MNGNEYFKQMQQNHRTGKGGGLGISWWIAFLVIAKIIHAVWESAPK